MLVTTVRLFALEVDFALQDSNVTDERIMKEVINTDIMEVFIKLFLCFSTFVTAV